MPLKKTGNKITIAPSILSADFSRLGTQLKETMKAGCNWLHLDIMDNHFVPNLTFGAPVVKSIRKAVPKAYFDAHLMVENPETLLEAFAEAGVQSLTIHQEACGENSEVVLKEIRKLGMKAGISIKPKTAVQVLEPLIDSLDLVLVMTVEPGFGGQELIPNCLSKLRSVKRMREKSGREFVIQADGGINSDTVELVVAAGAQVLVAGSAVYNDQPIKSNVEALMRNA